MKKMNNKGFSLVELIVVVAIMAVLMAVLVPTLIRNVEKTRVQKDKSAIAEIHHATELAIADEEFLDAQVTAAGATATTKNGGVITVADLFEKTKDSAGAKLAEEVGNTVGATVKLTSKMKNDCVVKVVYLDTAAGKVVFTVKSTQAKEDFFIDSTGENAGSYKGTTVKGV
jgi:type IV pilus assembly protein PilA